MENDRAEIAALVRKNCDKGLGANCTCANKIAEGRVGLETARWFLDSLLTRGDEVDELFAGKAGRIRNNSHVVVIEGGFGLFFLLGMGAILTFPKGDGERGLYDPFDLAARGVDLFAGVEDAVVIEDDVPPRTFTADFSGQQDLSSASGMIGHGFHLAFVEPLSRQTVPPGKGEGAHITKFVRGRKGSGNRAKGWGSSRHFKGGN